MKRKLVSLFLSLSLMVVSVTGCQSDSVTEKTKKEVQTKKSQVLSLYKEIETMIQKNHIEADADFAKMKDKLTSMSKKVDENKKSKKGAYQRICLFLKSDISLYRLILSKS